MSSFKAEFNTFLPVGETTTKGLAQSDKFFMVCILIAMSLDLASVRDQILTSLTIPTLQEVFPRLLRMTFIPPLRAFIRDNSALVSSYVQCGPWDE